MKLKVFLAAVVLFGLFAGAAYRSQLEGVPSEEFGLSLTSRAFDLPLTVQRVPESHDNRTCHCGWNWHTCPCASDGRFPSQDYEVYSRLGEVPIPRAFPGDSFRTYLRDATGYDSFSPGAQPVSERFRRAREDAFRGGRLEEVFLDYDIPNISVRALYAFHPEGANDLFLFTLGSWATPEHLLGMRIDDDSYHRQIAQYYFDQGMDVAVFDHGSNGTIENFLNLELSVHGGQVLGLWARSMCDFAELQREEGGYDRVILYGLSRGGFVVQYAATLCAEYDLAIVGDNFSHSNWSEYYWDAQRNADYGKYGSWFSHLQPVVGIADVTAFMAAFHGPVVFTKREEVLGEAIPTLQTRFSISDGFDGPPALGLVFKTDIGHTPELELIDQMLRGDWASLSGYRLEARTQ